IETLGKKSGTIDASISNRIQEMEERISGAEDSIENIGTTIKENGKCKKILTQNIQEIQDTMRRPNLRIIGVDENEDFQLKGPANIFNKIIEENFPNLKKEMPMNIQEAVGISCLTDVLTDGDMSGLTTMIPAETQHSYALLFCFSSDVVSLRGHAEQNLPT
ncbi:mCG140854, isoform CRA_b, partial [Mus musculus]